MDGRIDRLIDGWVDERANAMKHNLKSLKYTLLRQTEYAHRHSKGCR